MKKPGKPYKTYRQLCAAAASRSRKRRRVLIKRVKHAYQLYKKHLTLDKTGEILGLTRERIRQMFEFGHKARVIIYLGRDTQRLLALCKKVDKTELVHDLTHAQDEAEVCAKYGISAGLFTKILQCLASGHDLAELYEQKPVRAAALARLRKTISD